MKSVLRLVLIALAAAGLLSCRKGSKGTTVPSEVRPSVSGLVSDVVSGAPVAGAEVALQGMTVTTGSDGRYSLTRLTAGQAPLTARHQGHDNFSQDVTVSGQTTTNVPMTPALAAQAAGVWRRVDKVSATRVDVSVDTMAEMITLVVDFKGSMDPPPETFRGPYSPTTGMNVTHVSPVAGNITFRMAPGGRTTGNVTNVPDPDITRAEFAGTATPMEVILTFTEFLTGGGRPVVETMRLRK